ncbi:hypothetical protein [Clostridium tertium]
MDVIDIAKFIYEIILQVINMLRENNTIDFTPMLYFLCIIIFIVIFKFIYSNRVLSSQKKYKFDTETLKENINTKNSILLFKNKKIDEIELLCRLNLLTNFNGKDYFNTLNEVDATNIHNYLDKIEEIINENIKSLKLSNLYSFSTKTFFADKVDLFFKDNNISNLVISILISLCTLYMLLVGITYILNVALQESIIIQILLGLMYVLALISFLFFITALDFIIKKYNKKNINKITHIIYLFLVNASLFLILFLVLKLSYINSNYNIKIILYIILFAFSIIFSIFSHIIITKFHTFLKKIYKHTIQIIKKIIYKNK